MSALLSCPRGGARTVDGRLVFNDGWTFALAQPPTGLSELVSQILRASGLQCAPNVFWLADAGGHGGLAAPGVVAIGGQDVLALAQGIWASQFSTLTSCRSGKHRVHHPSGLIATFEDVYLACLRFLIAHELGHCRQKELHLTGDTVPLEADGDRFAGWIAEALGWDARLDRLIAHAIGCPATAEHCEHPHPDGRVRMYEAGRLLRRQDLAQQRVFMAARA